MVEIQNLAGADPKKAGKGVKVFFLKFKPLFVFWQFDFLIAFDNFISNFWSNFPFWRKWVSTRLFMTKSVYNTLVKYHRFRVFFIGFFSIFFVHFQTLYTKDFNKEYIIIKMSKINFLVNKTLILNFTDLQSLILPSQKFC